MDFVKREDQNVAEDDSYKIYYESLQKSHQMDADYQHTPISMEQLHQAMQSSLNASTIVHNFQLPLSPRQMSTLMLKSNHLSRSLNFNEIPNAHLPRNLIHEMDPAHNLAHDLPQNLRHEEVIGHNLSRNLDLSLVRSLSNELDLQHGLVQTLVNNLNEQDLTRNLANDLPHDLNQEIDLSHHLNRHLESNITNHEERRTTLLMPESIEQNLVPRLESRLDQRLVNNLSLHERLDQNEHLLSMPFHIKSEQEDGFFYENINQGLDNGLEGHIEQSASQSSHQENQLYSVYSNHISNVPALNPIHNYIQNYVANNSRENPQNLVVHRQFENASPYQEEFKKLRQDGDPNGAKIDSTKTEEPKENLKPTDENKIFYADYNNQVYPNTEKNDSESLKMSEELSMNIKGEYACYKCNEVFPSKRGLKQHSKACIENGEDESVKLGKFCCPQCSYRCQSPAILKIHERTHSGEKPFSCTFCDYKSGQKNNVAKHVLVHMKEKPFRCQYCDYRCAQKNNLVVHERTHTGYKPFACLYCDYRTVQKPNLVKHMYLHTDQKPFSCDMCNYRCVQKTNLTKHKQRHLNEKDGGDKIDVKNQVKPYRPRQKSVKCAHCSYRCVQKSSLDKHMQFKHAGMPLDDYVDSFKIEEEAIQNLSVKKDELFHVDEKEPLPNQS